jgi:hypothetical protein
LFERVTRSGRGILDELLVFGDGRVERWPIDALVVQAFGRDADDLTIRVEQWPTAVAEACRLTHHQLACVESNLLEREAVLRLVVCLGGTEREDRHAAALAPSSSAAFSIADGRADVGRTLQHLEQGIPKGAKKP